MGARVFRRRDPSPLVPSSWKGVLWVRLDHVGDVVMSLPMLRALTEALPEVEVDCLVRPSVAPVLRASGLRVNVLTYDSPRFPEKRSRFGRGDGLSRTLALVRRLRARRYDAAFELRGDEVGRVLTYLARIPVRIGPDRQFYEVAGAPNGAILLSHPVPFPDEPRHQIFNNLALLTALKLTDAPVPEFRFPLPPELLGRVENKLARLGVTAAPVICHVGSNDPARNWTDEGWVRISETAAEQGYPVLFTGISRDAAIVRGILARLGPNVVAYDATGLFTLEELPALFARARAMVTVDTGPMHLAAFSGLKLLALMRADLAPRHAPFGQPDHVVTAPAGAAVAEIPPDGVVAKFRALLEESTL